MNKISKASFICAIILIVCAIVLNAYGFSCLNGFHVYRQTGFGYMHMSYYVNTSMTNTCFAMIMAGGFLFIGGILLLMLSAMTRSTGRRCCQGHRGEVGSQPMIESAEQCCGTEQTQSEENSQEE